MQSKPIKKELADKLPLDIRRALNVDAKIIALWKDLTPLGQRDFITWIDSAKQPETRKRRIGSLASRLSSGKRRPCCYAVVPMSFYKALGATPKAKATWKDLTPDQRRDFVGWIEEAKDKVTHGARIEKACNLLSTGKRAP